MPGEVPTEGYPPFRTWDEGDNGRIPQAQDRSSEQYIPYAWSLMNLFCSEEELISGIWKIPLYKPPTNIDANPYDFATGTIRFGDPYVWMRIAYPDDQTDFECSPALA